MSRPVRAYHTHTHTHTHTQTHTHPCAHTRIYTYTHREIPGTQTRGDRQRRIDGWRY